MIEVIFFDFDGVIVESVDIKTKAFAELFRKEGEEIMVKVVNYHLNNTGVSRYEKFRYIYKEFLKRTLGEDEFQSLCDRFARLVVDAVVAAPYVPGAFDFLKNEGQKYRCYIVSATPQSELEEIVQKKGISGFFRGIYGAPEKKSDMVKRILAEENIKPTHAVYIGDAMSDFLASKDNSVYFIARINNNEEIFNKVECSRVKDLTPLAQMIGNKIWQN